MRAVYKGYLPQDTSTSSVQTCRDRNHALAPVWLEYCSWQASLSFAELGQGYPVKGIDIGKALAELRQQNILVIGSGMSFHSFPAMRRQSADDQKQSQAFDHWLVETCCSETLTVEEREQRLSNWESAPSARFCHPREEHLLPLHVCFGMAASAKQKAKHAYSESWKGLNISAFLWE